MKKYISYIGLMIFSVIITSCNKDSFDYKDGYVGSSKITTYPIVTVTGAPYIAVPKGGTFTDPGAIGKAGTADAKITISGLPNVNVAGVYLVTYTATNADGFTAVGTRTVAVYSTDATATGNDFSGNYARTSNGSLAVWTKLAPGVYTVFNPGGAPGTNLTVVVFNQTGYKVFIPSQIAAGNPTSSASESSIGSGTKLTQYSMEIVNVGYGTSVRTFVKQ